MSTKFPNYANGEYASNITWLSAYLYGQLNQNIPTSNAGGSWVSDYAKALTAARSTAVLWVPNWVQVPAGQPGVTKAGGNLLYAIFQGPAPIRTATSFQPGSPGFPGNFNNQVNVAAGTAKSIVSSLQQAMNSMKSSYSDMGGALSAGSAQIKADQKAINQLRSEMSNFVLELFEDAFDITVDLFEDAVTAVEVTIGVVGAVLAPEVEPADLLDIAQGVISEGKNIADTANDSAKFAKDVASMQGNFSKLKSEEKNLALMYQVYDSLQTIASEDKKALKDLSKLQQYWAAVEQYLDGVAGESNKQQAYKDLTQLDDRITKLGPWAIPLFNGTPHNVAKSG
jgi:hypothetical protein